MITNFLTENHPPKTNAKRAPACVDTLKNPLVRKTRRGDFFVVSLPQFIAGNDWIIMMNGGKAIHSPCISFNKGTGL